MENSLVPPRFRFKFNMHLREDMRSRIYAILQRKCSSANAATLQAKLRSLAYNLENKLVNLANSEEEYSDLGDLEVRINHLVKNCMNGRSSSQRSAMSKSNVSHGIEALPDSLISQILLWLPTKETARTSVLSSRWRNLWLDVPGLDFDFSDLHPSSAAAINNLIDRFMESRLKKFKLQFDYSTISLFGIRRLFHTVINHGVEHLHLEFCGVRITKYTNPLDIYKSKTISLDDCISKTLPLDFYKSKTLVSLKLGKVGMENPDFVVSLPCLKVIHLDNVMCRDEDPLIIEKLISGCPVLEDLTVSWGYGHTRCPVVRVRSQTLQRFCQTSPTITGGVDIDAPRLKYMNYRDTLCDGVGAKNLKSLFMIDIDAKWNPYNMKERVIRDFLDGISSARHMIISHPTVEVLHPYFKQGTIKFGNLSRLEASFCNLLLQVLPDFLQSFPNLKHLTLYLVRVKDQEPENLKLTIVPRCLQSTLECVEIKEETGMKRPRNGKKHQKKIRMEAVRYILENSLVLKKLVLCFSPKTIKASEISKAIDTCTKRSPKCEVFIRWQTSL